MTSTRILVHASVQAIRGSDMDMPGRVNIVVYFRCMEQARVEWRYATAGVAKIVWIDTTTGQPHPLPDITTAPRRAVA